ncbi:MAG: hypothetical protein M3150_02760 [Pseudomonadota bacterium]|nr:hypothetical protein [Pseudomonadota bacterium]
MHPTRLCFLLALALLACEAAAQAPHDDARGTFTPVVLGQPLSDSNLGALRGGTDTTLNDMQLNGTTASNSAVNVTTGSNAISSGAFSSMSGIPVVIQNTGANVLIQNAVILNLRVQ